jgi:hypothetical protein
MFQKISIMFLGSLLLCSCERVQKEIERQETIKGYIEKNCNCEDVDGKLNISDEYTDLTYTLKNCKFNSVLSEAEKIMDGIKPLDSTLCEIDEINWVFVNETTTDTVTYINCEILE